MVATYISADPSSPGSSTVGAKERCPFAGSPGQIRFGMVVSYDPKSDRVYLQIDNRVREGTREQTTFLARSPDGDEFVPRQMDKCPGCEMKFAEHIQAALVQAIPAGGCPTGQPPKELSEACENPTFDPRRCGAICGELWEEVSPAAGCKCKTGLDTTPNTTLGNCVIVYHLEGTRN
jgi:hypothetical protein